MKRVKVNILDIAGYAKLAEAAVKAARGKHNRTDVRKFFARFDENLNQLRKDILAENAPRYASRIERMPPKAYRGLCLRRQGVIFINILKKHAKKQAFEMTPPKERHQADREWVGGATPLFEKTAPGPRKNFYL